MAFRFSLKSMCSKHQWTSWQSSWKIILQNSGVRLFVLYFLISFWRIPTAFVNPTQCWLPVPWQNLSDRPDLFYDTSAFNLPVAIQSPAFYANDPTELILLTKFLMKISQSDHPFHFRRTESASASDTTAMSSTATTPDGGISMGTAGVSGTDAPSTVGLPPTTAATAPPPTTGAAFTGPVAISPLATGVIGAATAGVAATPASLSVTISPLTADTGVSRTPANPESTSPLIACTSASANASPTSPTDSTPLNAKVKSKAKGSKPTPAEASSAVSSKEDSIRRSTRTRNLKRKVPDPDPIPISEGAVTKKRR